MMPPKKRSRAASRCKPVLGNVTNQVNAAQTELIIEDYKKNAAMCIERVKEEQLQIEKSLQEVYANYRRLLEPLNHITVAQLLLNEEQMSKRGRKNKKQSSANSTEPVAIAMEDEPFAPVEEVEEEQVAQTASNEKLAGETDSKPKDSRISEVSALLAEASIAVNEISRPKRKAARVPGSASRSNARNGNPSRGSMRAPATARAVRTKKVDGLPFVTPAGQRIVPNAGGARLLVTPKFDPRVPLPPGTRRRRPLPNEVPMSLTGSPLTISPPKPRLKEIMSSFVNTLEEEVSDIDSKDLKKIHAVLDRFIESRPSDP